MVDVSSLTARVCRDYKPTLRTDRDFATHRMVYAYAHAQLAYYRVLDEMGQLGMILDLPHSCDENCQVHRPLYRTCDRQSEPPLSTLRIQVLITQMGIFGAMVAGQRSQETRHVIEGYLREGRRLHVRIYAVRFSRHGNGLFHHLCRAGSTFRDEVVNHCTSVFLRFFGPRQAYLLYYMCVSLEKLCYLITRIIVG